MAPNNTPHTSSASSTAGSFSMVRDSTQRLTSASGLLQQPVSSQLTPQTYSHPSQVYPTTGMGATLTSSSLTAAGAASGAPVHESGDITSTQCRQPDCACATSSAYGCSASHGSSFVPTIRLPARPDSGTGPDSHSGGRGGMADRRSHGINMLQQCRGQAGQLLPRGPCVLSPCMYPGASPSGSFVSDTMREFSAGSMFDELMPEEDHLGA